MNRIPAHILEEAEDARKNRDWTPILDKDGNPLQPAPGNPFPPGHPRAGELDLDDTPPEL